ncbi:MAG: rhomboid family intramembrane serine protease [Saprospiraceae bacterium]|nr:rhomboid family intramembrane serine protease [Saprospiraceae bacterium]
MDLSFIIIGVTVVISYLAFNNSNIINDFIFHPYTVKRKKQWYRFITHGFLHGDINHLLFNMLTLFFFGPNVEAFFRLNFGTQKGNLLFIALYFISMIASSIPAFVKHQDNTYYRSLGASGAISAVLFSFILFAPLEPIYLFFIPIPIPGFVFAFLYLAYSAYMAKRGRDNIGHDAHFVGAVMGLLLTVAFIPSVFPEFVNTLVAAVQNLIG